nr:CvpA family protein [Clostridia bacterium]
MSIIIDILLVAIIVIGVAVGVKKGFVRSVMNFVTFIASFICAWQFTPILAEYYCNSHIMSKVTGAVSDAISAIIGNGVSAVTLDDLIAEQPPAFSDIVNRYSASIEELERFYYNQTASGAEAIQHSVSEFIAGPVAETLAVVLAFLSIFLGVTVVLTLAAAILDLIFKLPVLNTLNRVLGCMIGAFCGLLYTWAAAIVLVAVIPSLTALYPEVFSESLFENSILLNVFYDYNPFRYLGITLGV